MVNLHPGGRAECVRGGGGGRRDKARSTTRKPLIRYGTDRAIGPVTRRRGYDVPEGWDPSLFRCRLAAASPGACHWSTLDTVSLLRSFDSHAERHATIQC